MSDETMQDVEASRLKSVQQGGDDGWSNLDLTHNLSEDAHNLLQGILDTDGAELQEPDWPAAEELKRAGLVTLSGRRGPDKAWRRAELVKEPAALRTNDVTEEELKLVIETGRGPEHMSKERAKEIVQELYRGGVHRHDPPTTSISISRKINLGNYESMDLFMSVNGVDKYTTQEEIDEALAAGELAYGQLKEHLRARVVEVMRTRTGQ